MYITETYCLSEGKLNGSYYMKALAGLKAAKLLSFYLSRAMLFEKEFSGTYGMFGTIQLLTSMCH